MKLNISDLRVITMRLLDHIESVTGGVVELKNDYYWNIPEERLYDMEHDPADFDVGQISDDWAELRRLMSEKNDPISYSLVKLTPILRAIGEKLDA